MIRYNTKRRIGIKKLDPFFKGWKSPPSKRVRSQILKNSDLVVTAWENKKLVGFLAAISDGAMHAFITLLEVLEPYQGQGIGSNLMKMALAHYRGYYSVALNTDPDKKRFYEKLGFEEIYALHIQDFAYNQQKSKP